MSREVGNETIEYPSGFGDELKMVGKPVISQGP
jgi:hypothetical protein